MKPQYSATCLASSYIGKLQLPQAVVPLGSLSCGQDINTQLSITSELISPCHSEKQIKDKLATTAYMKFSASLPMNTPNFSLANMSVKNFLCGAKWSCRKGEGKKPQSIHNDCISGGLTKPSPPYSESHSYVIIWFTVHYF